MKAPFISTNDSGSMLVREASLPSCLSREIFTPPSPQTGTMTPPPKFLSRAATANAKNQLKSSTQETPTEAEMLPGALLIKGKLREATLSHATSQRQKFDHQGTLSYQFVNEGNLWHNDLERRKAAVSCDG